MPFKILKGIEGSPMNRLFSLNSSITRGNSLKLSKPDSRLNISQLLQSTSIVNTWNCLLKKVVPFDTVNGFKNAIDRYLQDLHGVSVIRLLNP